MRRSDGVSKLLAPFAVLAMMLGVAIAGAGIIPGTAAATTAAASLDPGAGQFTPVPQVKVLDTRSGLGGETGALASGQSVTYQVEGQGDIPDGGVSAVYVEVSAISPTESGCLVDYSPDTTNPGVCNTSFEAGENTADSDIVQVGLNGSSTVTNQSSGTVQVAISVVGYYTSSNYQYASSSTSDTSDTGSSTAGMTYVGLAESAIVDTREGLGAPKAEVAAGGSLTVTVAGSGGVPTDAGAVAVYLGAADSSTAGTVDAYEGGQSDPGLSDLSYRASVVSRNLVVIPLSSAGQITLTNTGSASTDIIVDVEGYFVSPSASEAGGTYTPLTSSRIFDTRNSTALAANSSVTFQVAGMGGVPSTGASAVAESVAVLDPVDSGYLDVYSADQSDPLNPAVNFVGGDNQDNDLSATTVSSVSSTGEQTVTNHSSGTVEVVVSVRGYFAAPTTPQTPTELSSTYSSGEATVSWDPPGLGGGDGGAAITGYVVTFGDGTVDTVGGTTTTLTAADSSSTDTVSVAAVNAVGTGVSTGTVSVSGGTYGATPDATGSATDAESSYSDVVSIQDPSTGDVEETIDYEVTPENGSGTRTETVTVSGKNVSTTTATTTLSGNSPIFNGDPSATTAAAVIADQSSDSGNATTNSAGQLSPGDSASDPDETASPTPSEQTNAPSGEMTDEETTMDCEWSWCSDYKYSQQVSYCYHYAYVYKCGDDNGSSQPPTHVHWDILVNYMHHPSIPSEGGTNPDRYYTGYKNYGYSWHSEFYDYTEGEITAGTCPDCVSNFPWVAMELYASGGWSHQQYGG